MCRPDLMRIVRSHREVARKMRRVAKEFGVKLYHTEDPDVLSDPYLLETNFNRSFAGGFQDISIGVYQDEELRLISFFHELGHTQSHWKYNPKKLQWDMELRAWEVGLSIAYRMGERFSDHALRWADKQLKTYVGYEETEVLNYVPYNPGRVFSGNAVRKLWRQLRWKTTS